MTRVLSFIVFITLLSVTTTLAQQGCANTTECEYGVGVEEIASYPEPSVSPLYPKDDVLYDRIYRKVEGAVDIYDSPGGNIVGVLGEGYNYVTLSSLQDGWAQISEGKWIQTGTLSEDVIISRYAGVKLPDDPLPYPMAWLLRHIYPSTSPGEDPNTSGPLYYRYTRVNIYDTVTIDGYDWYQIGVNEWVHQFNVAKIIPIERPEGVDTEKWISVDLYEQVLVAYEGDRPVFSTLVSSGLADWPTNEGVFHVYLRYPRTLMAGAYDQPDFYYLEEVPWTMYFDDDIALHGTYWHDGFGYRQSHGCVNLSITDAKWLYDWADDEFDFAEEDHKGPAVYVYSSGEYD